MANRRMFSLDVVDTDRFLDMSASAQALYFHLGMRADDDGFVSSPRKIAKASNCGLDDLTLLAAKGFIIPFESGVVVVTHWKENNYIRADRYKPTRYTKEAEMLEKIGDVYQLSTTGIPTDNQMVDTWDTQDRLGKDIYNTCAPQDGERVQFDQNDDVQYTDPEKKQSQIDERKENFEKIYAIYPKKRGKQRAFGLYCQWLKGRVIQGERIKLTNKEMYVAVRNYVRQQEQEQPDQKYWKNFDTLMGATLLDSISDGYFKEPDTEPLYTGLEKLDNTLGGLEGGDMIVIGARPAVGKSAFVTQIAINLADRKKKIAFYNLEMSDKQVYERLLSRKSRIGLNRIRRARSFLGDEKDRFDKANQELKKSTLFIRSGAVTVSQIRNECRHLDLDCIVIDYIQLLRADIHYQSRANEVGAISKAIKALAMELNIPIIALSQLNRVSEMRQDKVPTMGELREAGDIEQDASIILLMWNIVDDKKGLKVEKNRQGILSTEVLRFDGDNMQFIETDESIKEAAKGFRKAEEPTPFD